MKGVPREAAESLLQMMFRKEMYTGVVLVRSEIETCDAADYTAFNDEDEVFLYKTKWAMRISEP